MSPSDISTNILCIGCKSGENGAFFSILRAYSLAVLPNGKDYTIWGRGVSQGHSDAIRRIDGVADGELSGYVVEE